MHGLTLITARKINDIHYKGRDDITYPFPNFNDSTVGVWERMNNFIPRFVLTTYPCWDLNKTVLVRGFAGLYHFESITFFWHVEKAVSTNNKKARTKSCNIDL